MTSLPFPDGSFDVVTSALAIHNIDSLERRYRALDEAMRVLRPGGQVLIADISPMTNKYAAYLGHGSLRNLGPGYWYGGPWFGVSLLHLNKKEQLPKLHSRVAGRPSSLVGAATRTMLRTTGRWTQPADIGPGGKYSARQGSGGTTR
jgi:SAM-dependent methyltransferase